MGLFDGVINEGQVRDSLINVIANRGYSSDLENDLRDVCAGAASELDANETKLLWERFSKTVSNLSSSEGKKAASQLARDILIEKLSENKSIFPRIIKEELIKAGVSEKDAQFIIKNGRFKRGDLKQFLNTVFPSAEKMANGNYSVSDKDKIKAISDLIKDKPTLLRAVLKEKFPQVDDKINGLLANVPEEARGKINSEINGTMADIFSPDTIQQILSANGDKEKMMQILMIQADAAVKRSICSNVKDIDKWTGLQNAGNRLIRAISRQSIPTVSKEERFRNLLIGFGLNKDLVNEHLTDDVISRLLDDDKALENFVGKVVPSLSEIKENGTSGLGAKMADNFKAAASDLKKIPQQPQNRSFLNRFGFGR